MKLTCAREKLLKAQKSDSESCLGELLRNALSVGCADNGPIMCCYWYFVKGVF